MGNFHHGDISVREKLLKFCETKNPLQTHKSVKCREGFVLKHLLLKAESVFCLEPTGDSFTRKSIIDSLSFGCN